MYDVLIRQARIIDGTGGDRYLADVALRGEKIARIGRIKEEEALRTVRGQGLVLAPGFIDMHGHSDIYLSENSSFANKLMQGITTEICGQCGLSMAPVNPLYMKELKSYAGFCDGDGLTQIQDWETLTKFNEYLTYAADLPLGANIACLMGQGTIRLAVMGFEDRPATPDELEKMKALVREGMDSGALGLSTGLIYAPGVYTPKEELVALCKVVHEYGGFYASHIRNESDHILEAVREAIDIGRQSGVPVEISHCKISGKGNWGQAEALLELVEQANREGLRVSLDQYPYLAGATHLYSAMPPRFQEGGVSQMLHRLRQIRNFDALEEEIQQPAGEWDSLIRDAGYEGILVTVGKKQMSIAQFACQQGLRPIQAAVQLILDSQGACPGTFFITDEQDMLTILRHDGTMIGTDAGAAIDQMGRHPRVYGCFPRILGRYVRERKVLTLETAIRKMTGLAAQTAGLENKGLLQEGYDADLVLFDPDTISDQADYDGIPKENRGMAAVFVNGEMAVENDRCLFTHSGRVIRKRRGSN